MYNRCAADINWVSGLETTITTTMTTTATTSTTTEPETTASPNNSTISFNSDYESVASVTSGRSGYKCLGKKFGRSESGCYLKKKRSPHTGSNISKPPTVSEVPQINNPAAWVSSRVQNDTKPIKN